MSYIALQQMLKQSISLEIFKRLSSINFTWAILEHLVPKHIKELTYPQGNFISEHAATNYNAVLVMIFFMKEICFYWGIASVV